jgi:triacylglycerol lipase
MLHRLSRRAALLGALAVSLLAACSTAPLAPSAEPVFPPIVFVHGNGDNAAVWTTTLWRFESNGWPRERLHAMDLPYPLARDDDTKPQDGRSSTAEHMQYLAAEVDKVMKTTGARQVVLIGNSRGGTAIRNYIANGGGAANVSHAVLGGTPNHGVWVDPARNTGNEFNGAGPFLTGLNAPKGPDGAEVTSGVKWMTIRSDGNDKFAQADGMWIGAKGVPTGVSPAGPALKGADNVVIPAVDHRETSFSAQAFAATFRFLTGRAPATLPIVPEAAVVLDGKVSGSGLGNDPARGSAPTNLPLARAVVEVYATNPGTGERQGAALHRKTIGPDGHWGPFAGSSSATYEFVVSAPGYATTHIYRSPFARSSRIVHLRAERIADADRDAKSLVTLTRPRGYFGVPRDQISLDGKSPPAGIPPGVAGTASAKLKLPDAAARSIAGEFNGERIVGRTWPAAGKHLVLLELHY